jgi:hypothetical protein
MQREAFHVRLHDTAATAAQGNSRSHLPRRGATPELGSLQPCDRPGVRNAPLARRCIRANCMGRKNIRVLQRELQASVRHRTRALRKGSWRLAPLGGHAAKPRIHDLADKFGLRLVETRNHFGERSREQVHDDRSREKLHCQDRMHPS